MRSVSSILAVMTFSAMQFVAGQLAAQKPPDPEVGYIYPPGAQRGQTVTVQLAGFDWTPDLEFFVLDERVKLVTQGTLSPHLFPEPPFPIGMKAYRPPALPREITATLELPVDLPPGPIRWQVANANGASGTGIFMVGTGPEIVENREAGDPQSLPQLPVTVSGRLGRYEEVDCYVLQTKRNTLITCDLQARRLGSSFHGVLEVRDDAGRLVSDAVDTAGNDLSLTWKAKAESQYRLFVRDLNFRGNRAYVYRLSLTEGPRVLATIPAAARRGETRAMELIGYGLATGRCELEQITRTIQFPDDPQQMSFFWKGASEAGEAIEFEFPLSGVSESVESGRADTTSPGQELPIAVTGRLDRERPTARCRVAGHVGDYWKIAANSRSIGSLLDVSLRIINGDGKELAANDDLPGTTDAGLEFIVPADGDYDVIVSDVSGATRSPLGLYRLTITKSEPDFVLQVSQHFNVPIGDKTELTVKAIRSGGLNIPISIMFDGMPTGIDVPVELTIPADQSELKIAIRSSVKTPSGAGLITIVGTARDRAHNIVHRALASATGNLAPQDPCKLLVESILIASTMKPVVKIRPIETDERTVHRGTTHLAELSIDRLDGFTGDVVVQMDSRQPTKFRQGIFGPDVFVSAADSRVFYPCFVPDRSETVDAYRILLVALVQVPDSRGRVRHLLSKMQADDASVAITVEGALLKVSVDTDEITAYPNETIYVPVKISRSAKMRTPVRLTVQVPKGFEQDIDALPMDIPASHELVKLPIHIGNGLRHRGKLALTLRALALQMGTPPTLSTSSGASPMDKELEAVLKAGFMPVSTETTLWLEFPTAQ